MPEIQMSEKLLKLRRRYLPSKTQNTKRKHSDKLLLRILREHGVDLCQIEHIVRKWSSCQSLYERVVPNASRTEFVEKTFRWNCKLPFCQRCNSWMKKKQARLIKKRFLGLIGDDRIDITRFSMLTINGPVLPLGSDFKPSKEKMANQLRYRMKRLDGAVMQGEFEIANNRKSSNDPFDGKIHLHAILYHPNHSRSAVTEEFKKTFSEKRAVVVASSFTERNSLSPNDENFQESFEDDLNNYASYTCDVDICLEDDQEETGQVLYDHLISICSIWSGGKRGLRFQPGLASAYKQKGIKLPMPERQPTQRHNYESDSQNSGAEIYQLSDVFKEELDNLVAITGNSIGGAA